MGDYCIMARKIILEWLFLMLFFSIVYAVIYIAVSCCIDRKGGIFWDIEKNCLKKLVDYNKKYVGQDYDEIRGKLMLSLSYEKAQLILKEMKETDSLLNTSLYLYWKSRLYKKKKLCDSFENELVKYRIIKLYEWASVDIKGNCKGERDE